GTAYGLMLSTKLIFFGCLLLLGTANYFLVRAIGNTSKDPDKILSLVRFVEVEIGIGLTVILTAASLTSQPPGVDLTQDRVTLHDIAKRYAPRMPRLSSPDVSQLTRATAELTRRADIAWSEYNHNSAGIFVLLIGLLAFLSRSKYFAWARMWPLVF